LDSQCGVPMLRSVTRVAKELGIDPRALRAAIRGGELQAFKPSKRTQYVRTSDVVRWLESREVRPASDFAKRRAAQLVAAQKSRQSRLASS
jgi:hypothetical protein